MRYAWLDRVHRVAGRYAPKPLARERMLDTHLLNVAFKRGTQRWSGYAYLHQDRDVVGASSATYGVRWVGKPVAGFGWTLEFARQYDYANNPQHFAQDYWLAEPAWTAASLPSLVGNIWAAMAGMRCKRRWQPCTLSMAGTIASRVTPAGGLDDRYAVLNGTFAAQVIVCAVAFHDYRADRGSR